MQGDDRAILVHKREDGNDRGLFAMTCKIKDERKREFGVGIKPPCDAGVVGGREG